MDLGMSGYQIIGGIAASYAANAAVNNQVQVEQTGGTKVLQLAVPVHCEVIAFGVVVTEDFAVQATDPVVSLKKATTLGGSETSLKALTLGSSNARGLTKGDGDRNVAVKYPKDNQTAIAADTDLDNGQAVYADLGTLASSQPLSNLHFWPGEVLIIEHTTAATGAGGSYVPFAIVKLGGPDFTQNNTWRELRDGEVVLD